MGPIDVRRLAALDLYGTNGSPLRRTIIFIEFFLGATGGIALGLWVALTADSLGWQLFGMYVAAASSNYIPLLFHALTLLSRAALQEELRGVDISHQLRRYTRLQFWLVVPLLFDVIAIPQALGARPANA